MLVSAALMIVTFINPFLIIWAWFRGIIDVRAYYPRSKQILTRTGLMSVTVAEIVFWASNIWAPLSNAQRDVFLWRFTQISIIAAIVGFMFAVMGAGRRRGLVALSAVIVPLSWLTSIILE